MVDGFTKETVSSLSTSSLLDDTEGWNICPGWGKMLLNWSGAVLRQNK